MVEVDKFENSLEIKVNAQFIGQHFFIVYILQIKKAFMTQEFV